MGVFTFCKILNICITMKFLEKKSASLLFKICCQDELMKKVKDILRDIPEDGTDPLSYTREWLKGRHVPVLELTKQATQEEVEESLASLNIQYNRCSPP